MRRKKTTHGLLMVCLLAVAGLIYLTWPDKQHQEQPGNYILDATGAGASADYTAACITLHQSLDTILTRQKAKIKQTVELPRQVPRIQSEGKIKWHSRHLLIEKPKELSVEAFVKNDRV